MPDLYEDPTDGTERNPLRDVVKRLEAELKDARSTITTFEAEKRSVTLSTLLEAKGLPAKVAGLIPSDADPEKWIEENGALFVAPATPAAPAPTPPADAAPVVDEDAEKAAADAALMHGWTQMRQTEQTATPAQPATTGDAALAALFKAAETGGAPAIADFMRQLNGYAA